MSTNMKIKLSNFSFTFIFLFLLFNNLIRGQEWNTDEKDLTKRVEQFLFFGVITILNRCQK